MSSLPSLQTEFRKIKQSVCASMPGTRQMFSLCPLKDVNTMTHFSPISPKNLDESICHLKTTTCCPDILPTGFFETVSGCMAKDILLIVNTSLLLGVFPQILKTAIIKPLLKKEQLRLVSHEQLQADIKPPIS